MAIATGTALAIAASTAAGVGASVYGANKSAKAQRDAANRTAAAADNANRVETMYKMMGQGASGINPFSTESQLADFFQHGGADGSPVGPSTGAFPLYADSATGQQGFEGDQFAQMVDEYSKSQDFWDSFRGQQEKRMEEVSQIPAVREEIERKEFEELGRITAQASEEQAQFAEAQGQAQAAQLSQALGAANTGALQNSFQGFGGVGGGGVLQNNLLANALNYGAQASQAELAGDAQASAIRNKAAIATNPFASGFEGGLINQRLNDFSTVDQYGTSFLGQSYAPQTAFMNATRPFSPGRITAPDQTIPTFSGGNPGAGWMSAGQGLMGLAGTLGAGALQNSALASMQGQGQQLGNSVQLQQASGAHPSFQDAQFIS
jgi:hypothetical protein